MKNFYLPAIFLLTFFTISCFSKEKDIHPSFVLSETGLKEIIQDQDRDIQKKILENPKRFLTLADFMLNQPEELFYLADKNHAVSRDQAPENLVRPSNYGISYTRSEREVSSLIIDQLKNLYEAAAGENLDIVFASGYRSFDYQENLYNRYVEEMGQEEADRVSARPGTSQHQLGTAVDFGSITDEYALTAEGIWLEKNAGTFGFSLSYPRGYEEVTGYSWECWHYRYITVEGVRMQKEFFSDIQQYLMEFWHNHREELKEVRR